MKQLAHFINIKIAGNHTIETIFARYLPSPLMSVVVDGCRQSGRDYNAGGAKYNTRYIQVVGIGTMTDILTAIKYNIFDQKRFTMKDLVAAIDANFEGYAMIRNLVLNHTLNTEMTMTMPMPSWLTSLRVYGTRFGAKKPRTVRRTKSICCLQRATSILVQ